MNTDETTMIFARDTLEDLFNLEDEELGRLLDLDLPESAFLSAARDFSGMPPRRFNCSSGPKEIGLSGLRPKVYLSMALQPVEARAATAKALWNLARSLYQDSDGDRSDLSQWIADGFNFELKTVNPHFIYSYSSDSNMLVVGTAGEISALATFKPLRKLVIH